MVTSLCCKIIVNHQTLIILYFTDLQSDQDLNDEAKLQANISEDRPFMLQDFTYNNSGVANRIFNHLAETEFKGITVSFQCYSLTSSARSACTVKKSKVKFQAVVTSVAHQ